MPSCKEVQSAMRSENPESVMFPPKSLDSSSLRQIPNSNCLIFTARDDQLVLWVKESTGDVVEMTNDNTPNLDDPIIGGAAEIVGGNVGWNMAKLTPRLCPSNTYLTVENESKVSKFPGPPPTLGEPFRRPEISQTRTVWSSTQRQPDRLLDGIALT